jgi:glycosyltransferase involved in cell wall biosynthesis
MQTKVSLIVPSLNVGDYIKECMNSVTRQSLREIEILCVDAGSEDGTREILQTYADADKRVRIIDSSMRSYGHQVNLGIAAASGEYVGIVESDDYVDRDMYRYLYQQARQYDVDVAKADSIFVYDGFEGRRVFEEHHLFSQKDQSSYFTKVTNDKMLFLHITDSNLWNGIYRRDFLLDRDIRLNESRGAAFQDIGFQQQVHTLAESFVYSDKPVYFYRMDRATSSTNQPGWLRYICQESEFLLSGVLTGQPEWFLHRGYIAARLAFGFVGELERSIIHTKFSLEQVEWLPYYQQMAMMIQQWINDGILLRKYLPAGWWEKLLLALHSLQSFRDVVLIKEKVRRQAGLELLEAVGQVSCVVFGCGIRGQGAAKLLWEYGREIVVFSDNNKILWGGIYQGIPVMSPIEAVQRYSDRVFVVANRNHGEDIRQQLLALGLPDKQIFLFTPG